MTEARKQFAAELETLDDALFVKRAETVIWLSAWANNNPRSAYHWQADAFYDEASRRGKPELYTQAWEQAKASAH